MLLNILENVPVVDAKQLADFYYPRHKHPIQAALRYLKQPDIAPYVRQFSCPVRPIVPRDSPLASWSPGEATPNFNYDVLAYHLHTRWVAPLVVARCVALKSRKIHLPSITHHLNLAALYLRLLREEPEIAQTWRLDIEFARERGDNYGLPLPDAVIQRNGHTILIEQCGSGYSKDRILHLVTYAQEKNFGIELW